MNIYANVINDPSAVTISTASGLIQIFTTSTGATLLSKPIPQKGITSAQRLALGSWPQAWTWTPASASIGQKYTLTVSGADTVSGVLRTWIATYTAVTATVSDLTAALTAIINGFGSCPVAAVDGSSLITVTSKAAASTSSTAAQDFKLSANLGTVANVPTLALTGTLGISTAGAVTGVGTDFNPELPVGSILIVNDGVDFYRGFVTVSGSDTTATVIPSPPKAIGTGSKGYAILSNGAYLEANDALAGTSGVELTSTNTYAVYAINYIDSSLAGNGARPDMIQSQALLFVNAENASFTTFDTNLATALGVTF